MLFKRSPDTAKLDDMRGFQLYLASSAAPSRRTLPRVGAHTPTMPRAIDDFPEALGPITPSPWPLRNVKLASCTMILCCPGGAMLRASNERLWRGGGNAIVGSS